MTSSHAYIPDQATIAEIDRIFHGLVAERKAPAYTYGIFDRNGLIHWIPLRILDWQRCVGLFLEGFSLLCELHGAQVPEGRVEPLVVVPPHVPVDVRA